MVYYPSNIKIPDKICVVKTFGDFVNTSNRISVYFSSKVTNPPRNTIAVVKNNFSGPFSIGKIKSSTGSFYAFLNIQNALNSKKDIVLVHAIQHWSLNEIFLSAVVQSGGTFGEDIEFVATTYGF